MNRWHGLGPAITAMLRRPGVFLQVLSLQQRLSEVSQNPILGLVHAADILASHLQADAVA